MGHRTVHILMAVALVACIGSVIQSSLSDSEPCPLCGQRTAIVGRIQCMTPDRTVWAITKTYRCADCRYEFVVPAEYVPAEGTGATSD